MIRPPVQGPEGTVRHQIVAILPQLSSLPSTSPRSSAIIRNGDRPADLLFPAGPPIATRLSSERSMIERHLLAALTAACLLPVAMSTAQSSDGDAPPPADTETEVVTEAGSTDVRPVRVIDPAATPARLELAELPPGMSAQDAIDVLLAELERLTDENFQLRGQASQVEISLNQVTGDLHEMQLFLADHHEYGRDFEEYQAIRLIAEKKQQEEALLARRQQRDEQHRERRERMAERRAEREKEQEEANRIRAYQKLGFSPLGMEVFTSRMGFFYATTDDTQQQIRYYPYNLGYVRTWPQQYIDYSEMTISGSVLNAHDDVRNIGIALTFFDYNGNQVGAEIVQVSNARPDVPYPFTASLAMATDSAFASSSVYVLYADPVPSAATPAAASPTINSVISK
jgi:hypothetical protein